ncbi:MAG: hypothetical protein ACLF0G_00770 [Candidatus Brocadiia bacterium]
MPERADRAVAAPLAGCILLALAAVAACGAPGQVEAEVSRCLERLPGAEVVALPAGPERLELAPDQGITPSELRGVALDDSPPRLGRPAEPYPPKMTDGFPPGRAPYVARGIRPFRFRYFHNEFSYGGWHNWAMADYAVTHGFSILFPYNHAIEGWEHLPEGTRWLKWGGFVDWPRWLPEHGIPEGRYDRLARLDVAALLRREEIFGPNPGFHYLMIDMEHPVLDPEELRQQPWFPAGAAGHLCLAAMRAYYDGYAKTYTAPVRAARDAGWHNISVYGWQPFRRTYWGLEEARVHPATHWPWTAFGRRIYEAVDVLNPSVYCFYWTPRNVAYVLANIDLNMKLVRSMPQRKPVRPYFWTLLHGGGGGWRWWRGQPIRDQDVRAMTALAFFTGIDGIVLWNWSGTGNHHRPALQHKDPQTGQWVCHDVMVGEPFERTAEGAARPTRFVRYDALHVLSVEEGAVRFQRIRKDDPGANYGVGDEMPVYAMGRDELLPRLRAKSEPVAAMVEGLALAKAFEYILRHGEVHIDVPAQEQFAEQRPIVRRVALGRFHLLATYDPLWTEQGQPRQVVLDDFAGHEGLTLVVPADAQTRLFVLKGPP